MNEKKEKPVQLNRKPKRLQHWSIIAICLGWAIVLLEAKKGAVIATVPAFSPKRRPKKVHLEGTGCK